MTKTIAQLARERADRAAENARKADEIATRLETSGGYNSGAAEARAAANSRLELAIELDRQAIALGAGPAPSSPKETVAAAKPVPLMIRLPATVKPKATLPTAKPPAAKSKADDQRVTAFTRSRSDVEAAQRKTAETERRRAEAAEQARIANQKAREQEIADMWSRAHAIVANRNPPVRRA